MTFKLPFRIYESFMQQQTVNVPAPKFLSVSLQFRSGLACAFGGNICSFFFLFSTRAKKSRVHTCFVVTKSICDDTTVVDDLVILHTRVHYYVPAVRRMCGRHCEGIRCIG